MVSRRLLPLFIVASLALSPALITAQAPAAAPGAKEQFIKLMHEVQVLQERKRFVDALAKLEEAEKLMPTNPAVYNLRGSLYLNPQLREKDGKTAREQFTKARNLDPSAMPPHFNLAETDFVLADWAAASKGFAGVLRDFPKLPLAVRHMVTFKLLVCEVKQGQIAEAEKLLKESFTFMDDTPAYYFSKAAIELGKKNDKAGNEWLTKGQVIFKPHDTASYIDTMMEAHFIDSMSLPSSEATQSVSK